MVWNLFTRIIHWFIAIPVLLDFIFDDGDLSHKALGYIAMAFTIIRLFWGFLTTDQARFTSFPLGFRSFFSYSKNLFTGKLEYYPGHNPIASWIYLIIWGLVIALGVTGYMMSLDAYWGEAWLEDLHEICASGLLILVLVHFAGMGIDSWKFKRKTWMGMINGKKGREKS